MLCILLLHQASQLSTSCQGRVSCFPDHLGLSPPSPSITSCAVVSPHVRSLTSVPVPMPGQVAPVALLSLPCISCLGPDIYLLSDKYSAFNLADNHCPHHGSPSTSPACWRLPGFGNKPRAIPLQSSEGCIWRLQEPQKRTRQQPQFWV